jgi:hypothetical protein
LHNIITLFLKPKLSNYLSISSPRHQDWSMPTFDKYFKSYSWCFHYYESNIHKASKKMLLISRFDVNINYRKPHVVAISRWTNNLTNEPSILLEHHSKKDGVQKLKHIWKNPWPTINLFFGSNNWRFKQMLCGFL